MRRLKETGILAGICAGIQPVELGLPLQAMVSLRADHRSRQSLDELYGHVGSLPHVVAVYHLAGGTDFMAHIMCRDAAHLRELLLTEFADNPAIAHMETG